MATLRKFGKSSISCLNDNINCRVTSAWQALLSGKMFW